MENFSKGDVIMFSGSRHYRKPNGKAFFTIKPGVAKITAIMKNAKHPYYLVAEPDSETTVNGWVDAKDIQTYDNSDIESVSYAKDDNVKICFVKEGDQAITVEDWNNQTWLSVCRCKDVNKAEKIATVAEDGFANKNIKFSEVPTVSLFQAALDKQFDLKEIKKEVETDKAGFLVVCLNAADVAVFVDMTLSSAKDLLIKTGEFFCFTGDDYTQISDFLRRGDILLGSKSGAIVLSNGVKSSELGIVKNPLPKEDNNALVGKGMGTVRTYAKSTIYSGPGKEYVELAEVKGKQVIEALAEESEGWYRIVWPAAKDGFAYISKKDCSFKENEHQEEEIITVNANMKPELQDPEFAGLYTTKRPTELKSALDERGSLVTIPKGQKAKNYGYYMEDGKKVWLFVQVVYKNTIYNGYILQDDLYKK